MKQPIVLLQQGINRYNYNLHHTKAQEEQLSAELFHERKIEEENMNQNYLCDPQLYGQIQHDTAYFNTAKAAHDAGTARIREATHLAEFQHKIAVLENKEDAYSRIEESSGGLAVPGITGSLKQLYKIGITDVVCLVSDPCRRRDKIYLLKAENGNVLNLPASVLHDDRKFLGGIACLLGKPVRLYSTVRNIAELVREYVISRARIVPLPYYFGWRTENDRWIFTLLNSSTHSSRIPTSPDNIPQETVFEEISMGNTLAAAERIGAMFLHIRPNARIVLFLWWHLAFLYMILLAGEFVPPMGLCICSQGPRSQLYLEKMFCWFGDEVISLGISTEQLCENLADRKDEPLVLSDRYAKDQNCELVCRVVAERQIPLDAKDNNHIELLAPVTLFSNGTSSLCCKSVFFTIEMDDDSWTDCDLGTISALSGYINDYLRGFSSYVQCHIKDLWTGLRVGSTGLEEFDLEELSPEAFRTLTTMREIRKFLHSWQKYLALNREQSAIWQEILSEDDSYLIQILTEASTAGDDLSSVFVSVSKRMVQLGSLNKLPADRVPKQSNSNGTSGGTIFTDESFWYFDRAAFSTVSHQCGASTVSMARSLNENHLLKGPRASNSTYMTRISVYDENGVSKGLRVYAFDRSLFEDPFSDFDDSEVDV